MSQPTCPTGSLHGPMAAGICCHTALAATAKGSSLQEALTDGHEGVPHISRHPLLDGVLHVVVGHFDELLEHWGWGRGKGHCQAVPSQPWAARRLEPQPWRLLDRVGPEQALVTSTSHLKCQAIPSLPTASSPPQLGERGLNLSLGGTPISHPAQIQALVL